MDQSKPLNTIDRFLSTLKDPNMQIILENLKTLKINFHGNLFMRKFID